MKQKLLFLFISIVFSAAAYSQYGAPMDLLQCNNEVFNLTVNTPLILNGQNPSQHIVSYYESQGSAASGTNAISDPISYVAPMSQVIFARVDFAGQHTIFDFSVQWGYSQQLPPIADVMVCDMYVLPQLPDGAHYYTAPNGGGTVLAPGLVITSTSTIYVHSGTGQCAAEDSFMVTVFPTPPVEQMPNITVCGSYTLPVLASPTSNYFSGPNGVGVAIPAGTVITATTTVYINSMMGGGGVMCFAESSFTVTVVGGDPLSVQITTPDTTVCYGSMVMLSAAASSMAVSYTWYKDGVVMPGVTGNNIAVMVTDTSSYTCMVSNGVCSAVSNAATITVLPQSSLDIMISGETCVGGSFTLGVVNPNPNASYVWSHSPVGGSVPVITTASSYTINNAILADAGVYTCTAMDACGSVYTSTISVTIGVCNNNKISGHVRLDADANGCTTADAGVPNVPVAKYFGNEVMYTYTDANGNYSFSNIQEGSNYTMLPSQVPGYTLLSPQPPGVNGFTVVGTENNLTGDFCLGASQLVKDAGVYFYAASGARPGFPVYYILVVYNNGGLPISGTATVNYNPDQLDFVSASPANAGMDTFPTMNTLNFTVNNLQPFAYSYYYLDFTVKVPPIVNAGDIVSLSAGVNVDDDADILNNDIQIEQTVVDSFDPNDITVHQGATIYEGQLSSYLDYTIRFQNTGTADAINVRVTNELDDLLDWSTFTPVYSSHGYRTERVGNNVVFTFDNIGLPPQSVDDAGSNGLVSYKIKPKANVTIGDIMKAQANIYFDFNLPIVTNEVSTEVIEMMGVPETSLANLTMYPNPASGKVTVDFGTNVEEASAMVYDIQGKTIMNGKSFGRNIELNISSVKAGMYFVKITSGNQSVIKKLIVK